MKRIGEAARIGSDRGERLRDACDDAVQERDDLGMASYPDGSRVRKEVPEMGIVEGSGRVLPGDDEVG